MHRLLQLENDFNFLWFNSMYKSCSDTMDDDEIDNDFNFEKSPKIESPTREDWNAHPGDKNDPKPGVSTDSQTYHITNLPPEIMQHILKFVSFDNIAKIRLVCKHFDNLCSSILNSEFNRLRSVIQQRLLSIKSQMPRRESARRKHALAREHDIIETLNMRLSLLHMTLGKHIERKYCCFFPGEIIDEVYRVLRYIENTPCLNHGYKVTDELFDLSTMAMEYFKEHIEPRLPEISYFCSRFP
ncbi:F-box only protein 28-like [Uloborus diversus]|uniref:F-box only protein 28-like n=1 Tax=Uloborus diversus TaxID=327109 RepID=UPI002409D917|nr:F-box only protein 28-like [Uloborus diversus]